MTSSDVSAIHQTIHGADEQRDAGMTLYAIHYAWVDGHATKAPVGIWGEGGISYYPSLTESHRKGGSQAETEAAKKPWAAWVEMRTEYGSTYGASWDAIDSDDSMESILTVLQAAFFSEPHPIEKYIDLTDDLGVAGEAEEPGEQAIDASQSGTIEPSQRIVIAQSWWIASELARRHPELIVHEIHPAGGMYDCLALLTPRDHEPLIQLNRVGTIQVPSAPKYRTSWANVLGAASPHAIVKEIEKVARLDIVTKAPRSTRRVLAYRFIAAVLNAAANDRHSWDARNEFIDSSGDWWPGDSQLNSSGRVPCRAR